MILKIRQLSTQKNKFESMMLALFDEMYSQNTMISFEHVDLWLFKDISFWDPPSLKFHNQTDIIACMPEIPIVSHFRYACRYCTRKRCIPYMLLAKNLQEIPTNFTEISTKNIFYMISLHLMWSIFTCKSGCGDFKIIGIVDIHLVWPRLNSWT